MIARRHATAACAATAISGSTAFSTGGWQCPTFRPPLRASWNRWCFTTLLSWGEGPDWDEARREGCESPLELRLLKAIRAAGLPEPVKQHEVYDSRGRLLTRADFAYETPKRILIYADGLEFHTALRQRIQDNRHPTNSRAKVGSLC